jgi:hypothetical protein
MESLNDIFRTFGPEYLERFGGEMPKEHRKAMGAILKCRTEEAGIALYECEDCGHAHIMYRSCGNRHCPTCQHHKTRMWLETQLNRQLPGHHFMLTFTVPESLRRFIRAHQRLAYAALFKASAEAIKKLAADDKHIGGDLPGFFGVLHTWGRTLEYHPHIHYIAPGGALSSKDGLWHPSRVDFYLPVRALSKIFRAKFRDEMKAAGIEGEIPLEVWEIEWNVNCQAVGESAASLKYLAPYVFKVAIANSRILKIENRTVTFRYQKPKSSRWRTMALEVMEFIRRFLQHVLPTGFMKVRYFGFINPNCKVGLDTISALIELSYGFKLPELEADVLEPWQPMMCPHCGGALKLRAIVLANGTVIRPG